MRAPLLLLLLMALLLALPSSATAASGWKPTGSMADARGRHAAVELADGRVLVAGGAGPLASAEIYDPATGTWTVTGSMNVARSFPLATRLADGRVLVAGGFSTTAATASAEVYDPATGVWTPAPPMLMPRAGGVLVRLADGRVLVAGGNPVGGSTRPLSSAELFDPAANAWIPTGAMGEVREEARAVLLTDGTVLVAGGYRLDGGLQFSAGAERYDPATGTWTPTGSLVKARAQRTLVRLTDGTVLAAGGIDRTGYLAGAERYDPATGTWAATGTMRSARDLTPAVPLPDGRVLLSGPSAASELYDPAGGTWADAGAMGSARWMHSATLLRDGRVLAAGGWSALQSVASAELWTAPTTRTAEGAAFGELTVGTSSERDVLVRNTGTSPLFVERAQIEGEDFAIVSDTCSATKVASGTTCTIRVRFTAALGARTASLTLADNAEASGPIALTGTGVAPVEVIPQPTPTEQPPAASPTPAPQSAPQPTSKLPCTSRRLITVTLKVPRGAKVKRGTVTINGKRLTRLKRGARRVKVDLRGRKPGVYTIRITFTTSKGKTVKDVRRYRTCAPGVRR